MRHTNLKTNLLKLILILSVGTGGGGTLIAVVNQNGDSNFNVALAPHFQFVSYVTVEF